MITNQNNKTSCRVSVIEGDGVGPEVVNATVQLIDELRLPIDWEFTEAGQKAFDKGINSGVPEETLDSISRNQIVLKGPLATPIGEGQKSANVTLRKQFETFANIRPARELPGINSVFGGRGINLTIVRENVEDLYAGIEHMQTPNVAQCLKLISRLGSQRVSHAALSWAQAQGATKVTVATKANIMKMTEGMFKREFEKAALEYPGVKTEHLLIDNAAHQLVIKPEAFEVIVTTNMNGDILSDLASGLVGGLGVAPSANIGYEVRMFEAVHGTAPDIAGKDKANPTAMILSSVMMLRNLGFFDQAQSLEQALFLTLEEGIQTADLTSKNPVGTRTFTEAVAQRIGKKSSVESQHFTEFTLPLINPEEAQIDQSHRSDWGVDVFVESGESPEVLGSRLKEKAQKSGFRLSMLSNRGTLVWPTGEIQPTCVDHFRCRFEFVQGDHNMTHQLTNLLSDIATHNRWMHVERLEYAQGVAQFTKAQGEQ